MNRRSSHAMPLFENEYCQRAALDQALRFLLRPSVPQSCGWPPLRSDQLFEEILLCVILHADWLSCLEGHSCIIFMATEKKLRTIGDSLPLTHNLLIHYPSSTIDVTNFSNNANFSCIDRNLLHSLFSMLL